MRLEQLRWFVATVDHGTMTAAAAAEHVTQPALTRAVRALERELGATLLHRSGNRLVVTDAGTRVLESARRVLAEVDAMAAVADQPAVRVRATPRQERELVRGAVARLLASGARPQVLVTTAESAAGVLEAVRTGAADVGVTDHPDGGEVLGWQETLLIVPGDWDVPDPVPADVLARLPLVAPAPGTDRRSRMDSGLAGLGLRPTIAAVTDQADLGLSLALSGVVAAFGYATAAAEAAANGARLVRLDPPQRRPVGYLTAGDRPAPAVRAFLDALRAEADQVLDPA